MVTDCHRKRLPAAGLSWLNWVVKRSALWLGLMLFLSFAMPALAAAPPPPPPIPAYAVGSQILNATTGQNETVTQLISNYAVLTNQGNYILLATSVGQSFTGLAANGTMPAVYTVTAVTLNAAKTRVIGVTLTTPSSKTSTTQAVVTNESATIAGSIPPPGGASGSGTSSFSFTPATGDVNNFVDSSVGNSGSNGHDGGGVSVCIPVIGCATIA